MPNYYFKVASSASLHLIKPVTVTCKTIFFPCKSITSSKFLLQLFLITLKVSLATLLCDRIVVKCDFHKRCLQRIPFILLFKHQNIKMKTKKKDSLQFEAQS